MALLLLLSDSETKTERIRDSVAQWNSPEIIKKRIEFLTCWTFKTKQVKTKQLISFHIRSSKQSSWTTWLPHPMSLTKTTHMMDALVFNAANNGTFIANKKEHNEIYLTICNVNIQCYWGFVRPTACSISNGISTTTKQQQRNIKPHYRFNTFAMTCRK